MTQRTTTDRNPYILRTAPSPIFADLARDVAAFTTFLLLLAAVGALALTIGG